jgi:hypothetical protein
MLQLGFFMTIDEVTSIVNCLKNILKSIIKDEIAITPMNQKMAQFNSNASASEPSKQIGECRKKICEIFIFIFKLKSDLHIRVFLNRLKDVSVVEAVETPHTRSNTRQVTYKMGSKPSMKYKSKMNPNFAQE